MYNPKKEKHHFFKEDICRLVLDFVRVGGRLNNNNLFYLMGSEIDDATAGSTMFVVSSLVGLWFLPLIDSPFLQLLQPYLELVEQS